MDAETLTRISLFYLSQQEHSVSFNFSKIAIIKMGDITVLSPVFLESWQHISEDVSELEWLLKQPGSDYLIEVRLFIARYLFLARKTDKAYMISLEIAEKMEKEFKNNPSKYALYVDTVLNLVELEYLFENLTQARFHIRKLIYLKGERMTRVHDITYWSAVLDEISNLVSRQDWENLEGELTGDIELINRLYKQILARKFKKQTVNELKETTFQDVLLEKKRLTYLRLIKKITGDPQWSHGVQDDFKNNPNDLLGALLFAEHLKSYSTEKLKSFWEREFLKHSDRAEALKAYWNTFEKVESEKDDDLEECQVTFFGGGEKIGGTSILLSINGHHLLLDAGMHLNEETYHPDYTNLYEKGLSFEDIDALLISHAHMDHTGSVPYIKKVRDDMPMYATEATKDLMKILLIDSARMGKRKGQDIYSEEDVQNTVLSVNTVEFHQTFTIPSKDGKEWTITYYPSGHILGAGAIYIEMKGISILFTGDFSVDEQKTVEGLKLPSDLKVDYLITESTYGFMPTNASMNRNRQEKLFVESIKRTMDNDGTMLIPAFAVGRAQEIILILKKYFKGQRFLPFNLFLDGRVTDVCAVYQRFANRKKYVNPAAFQDEGEEQLFFGGGVQAAQDIYSNRKGSDFTFEDFMDVYIHRGNNCVVASSGMLNDNSASARYAEQLIDDRLNSVSFTGYMDEESPGSHVLQNAKHGVGDTVRINGEEKEVQARVESFRLSAHASREQILELIMKLQPKKVFLMHGEHTRRFDSIQTIISGEVIYPSLIDLLLKLKGKVDVTPAFNGETYGFKREE